MKYTLSHLQKLKEAYATGALEVSFGGHKVVYRSEKEMAQIIEKVEQELGLKERPKRHFFQARYHKGIL